MTEIFAQTQSVIQGLPRRSTLWNFTSRYGWHDSGRSDTVKTIALAAEAMGLAISSNTVLRFLRRAQSEFPLSADCFRAQPAREVVGKLATAGEAPTVDQATLGDRSSIEIGETQLSCESA